MNATIKVADPRAKIGAIDSLTDGLLKFPKVMGSPKILLHWARASVLSTGSPLPYALRMGRDIELIEDGSVVIRAFLNMGLKESSAVTNTGSRPSASVDVGDEPAAGERRLTPEEFEQHFGWLPTDGEG